MIKPIFFQFLLYLIIDNHLDNLSNVPNDPPIRIILLDKKRSENVAW